MRNSIKVTAIAAAMSLFSSATIAQVVDFDGPIPAGVTVEYFRNTGGVLAALPTTLPDALTFVGSAVPGGDQALLLFNGIQSENYGALFTFSSLPSFVSMVGNDFGGSNPDDNEIVYLSVFGESGNFLGSATVQEPFAEPNLQPISFGIAGIKYAAFTFSNDLGYYSLDNVVAVPEPETYALLLAGLGLMGAVARRRKQA